MKASISLDTMLIFTAVALLWVVIFRSVAPYLAEMKEKALAAELEGECRKLAGLVDTLSTYGKGTYVDYAPFAGEGIFFCQDAMGFCSSRNITAVKVLASGGVKRVSCSTRIAEWVNLKHGGELLSCEKAISGGIHSVNITLATYDEKAGKKRECE